MKKLNYFSELILVIFACVGFYFVCDVLTNKISENHEANKCVARYVQSGFERYEIEITGATCNLKLAL